MTDQSGTVLWYRTTMGRGMVKGDDGRRLFFADDCGVEAVSGLRIAYAITAPASGGAPEASGLTLEGGARSVLDPTEYLPQPKVKKRATAAKKKGTAAKKPAKAKKVPARPKKAPGAAMAAGTPVSHADFGAGFVLSSTKTFVRVEFLSGEERSLPFAEIEDVGGKRGAPAPTRKKRAAPAPAEKPAGRSHVKRDKTDDE